MKDEHEEHEVDEVDLEAEAKAERKPKKAKKYRLRIDKEKYVSEKQIPSGREILALAGKTHEKFVLTQKIHKGGTVQIAPEENVDLRKPGIERFMTLARDATDGDAARRMDFALRPSDVEALDATGLKWEAIKDAQGAQWVFLYEYPLCAGYSSRKVTLALLLVPGYPDAQIDMAFVSPALTLISGRTLANLSPRPINGVAFQQWSRHRTAANPWRPGIDDVGTHLVLVKSWFDREIA